MVSFRKFIFYATIFSVFTDKYFINVGSLHFFCSYVLIVLGLMLFAVKGYLWVPRGLLFFLGILLLSGVWGLLRDSDSVVGFAKSYIGIVPSAFYYCAFMRFIDFDVERSFEVYARFALGIAIFGIVIFPFTYGSTRLYSIMQEPSFFCLVCLPALYYYADLWLRERRGLWQCLVILFAYVMTFSGMGFLGLLLAIYLLGTRYRFGKLLAPSLIFLVGLLMYSQVRNFRIRVDDSLQGLVSGDLTGINPSSFGTVSNIFVTSYAFRDHPLIGGGLGSYVVAYDRYFGSLSGAVSFFTGDPGLGRWDGLSFALRITSEFGIAGLCLCAWFLWHFFPRNSTPQRRSLAMAFLCYIFLKFVRAGGYFEPEVFFFFLTYVVNGMMVRREARLLNEQEVEKKDELPGILQPFSPESSQEL